MVYGYVVAQTWKLRVYMARTDRQTDTTDGHDRQQHDSYAKAEEEWATKPRPSKQKAPGREGYEETIK